MNNASDEVGVPPVSALVWSLLASALLHVLLILAIDARSQSATKASAPAMTLQIRFVADLPEPIQNEAVAATPTDKADAATIAEPAQPLAEPEIALLTKQAITEQRYYEAKELDVLPQPLSTVQLEYPPGALSGGVSCKVKLDMFIDENGNVVSLSVLHADVPGVFDQAAIDAFTQRRFKPGIKDGKPVKSHMKLTVQFGDHRSFATQH